MYFHKPDKMTTASESIKLRVTTSSVQQSSLSNNKYLIQHELCWAQFTAGVTQVTPEGYRGRDLHPPLPLTSKYTIAALQNQKQSPDRQRNQLLTCTLQRRKRKLSTLTMHSPVSSTNKNAFELYPFLFKASSKWEISQKKKKKAN